MKGFLMKDYRLLLSQKNLFFVMPLGIIFMFTNETPIMGISYTLYVLIFLCTSLMSYDSFENGMTFLMTLPGGRRAYVTEKYLFVTCNAFLASLLLGIIGSALELSRGKGFPAVQETLVGTLLLCAFSLSFAFIILPIQLKYGAEKSRIIVLFLFALIFLGSMGIRFIAEKLNFNPDSLWDLLNTISLGAATAIVVLLATLFGIISWFLSRKFMSRMEF